MSKAIRWQVPFASISGTKYRVDIYDEQDGTWSGITQLLAGETPFVTDEDSSEDFFCPLRPQTGTLQVCTALPDGGRISLDELLPANSIARPVRLLKYANGSYSVIEWQGFLSCEAYSQDYIGIPQNLDLPLIGVLEAMRSVQIRQDYISGWMQFNQIVYQIMLLMEEVGGVSLWDNILYSATSYRFFQCKIDTSIFYSEEETSNDTNETMELNADTCADVLEKICKYMGWTAREFGQNIYIEYIDEPIGMYTESYTYFGTDFNNHVTFLPIINGNIASLDWRGDSHKKNIRQGAKSVKITSKIDSFDLKFQVPGFPYGNVSEERSQFFNENYTEDARTPNMHTYFNLTPQPYPECTALRWRKAAVIWDQSTYRATPGSATLATMNEAMPDTIAWKVDGNTAPYKTPKYAGAFFVRHASRSNSGGQYEDEPLSDGLYCTFIPGLAGFNPIFTIWTNKYYSFRNGKLHLKIDFSRFFRWSGVYGFEGGTKGNFIKTLRLMLKVGNMYANQSDGWSSSQFIGDYTFNDETLEWDYKIDQYLSGTITLSIMAGSLFADNGYLFDTIIKSIDIQYEPIGFKFSNDRDENRYFSLLSTNFRDNINVDVDMSSYMNNKMSPSVIRDGSQNSAFLEQLTYSTVSGTEDRRPEVDLLNRLASYYGASRQTLDLITKHPTAAVLPLLKLNGIGDNKTYLPLSESRDWREETCTLKCFETPT